jgi:hypothetical protein
METEVTIITKAVWWCDSATGRFSTLTPKYVFVQSASSSCPILTEMENVATNVSETTQYKIL